MLGGYSTHKPSWDQSAPRASTSAARCPVADTTDAVLIHSNRYSLRVPYIVCSFIIFSILFLSPNFSAPANAAEGVQLLGYTFTFDGKTYDPVRDESTWHYTVAGPDTDAFAYNDVPDWMLALCTPGVVHDVKYASNGGRVQATADRNHQLVGLRWDATVSSTASASFYFTLRGDWEVDESVTVSAGDGRGFDTALLPGPACQSGSCRLDYEIKHRADWRILQPGTYAAVLMQIHLHGDSDVRLTFRDFGEPENSNPSVSTPPIYFEYSIGDTIQAAEARGWLSAGLFNSEEVIVPHADVSAGVRINVWGRAVVTDYTMSSEYSSRGTGGIGLVCR